MIDTDRLEKVKRRGNKVTARCPACAETGNDNKGQHLVILADGKFGCAANAGDTEHRKRIHELVGVPAKRQDTLVNIPQWKRKRQNPEKITVIRTQRTGKTYLRAQGIENHEKSLRSEITPSTASATETPPTDLEIQALAWWKAEGEPAPQTSAEVEDVKYDYWETFVRWGAHGSSGANV